MRSLKITWLAHPVYRALWLQQAPSIAPEFAAVIETTMREVPLSESADLVSRFRTDLASITAR